MQKRRSMTDYEPTLDEAMEATMPIPKPGAYWLPILEEVVVVVRSEHGMVRYRGYGMDMIVGRPTAAFYDATHLPKTPLTDAVADLAQLPEAALSDGAWDLLLIALREESGR